MRISLHRSEDPRLAGDPMWQVRKRRRDPDGVGPRLQTAITREPELDTNACSVRTVIGCSYSSPNQSLFQSSTVSSAAGTLAAAKGWRIIMRLAVVAH